MEERFIKNIAVFIDVENIYHNQINLKIIIDKLKEKGRLIVRKAYADWGRFAGYKREMLDHSIELIELPSHSGRGKNSADIKLVVDALETVFTKEHIDTFTVISGDSDYIPLISKLREYNKHVIVIAYDQKSTNKLIKNYCDELIYYTSLAGLETLDKKDLQAGYLLLVKVLNILDKEEVQHRGSVVKQYMKRLDAAFDEVNLGFRQFKSFLESAEKDNIIILDQLEEGDYLITLNDNIEYANGTIDIYQTYDLDISHIEYLFYWSIVANQMPDQKKVLLGPVMETLKLFDPDFNITHYGTSKNKGFKAFVEKFFVKRRLVELERNDKNEIWLTLCESFQNHYASSTMPEKFKEVYTKRLIGRLGLTANMNQIRKVVETAHQLLKQDELLFIKEFTDHIFEVLSENNTELRISLLTYKRIIAIILLNQGMIGEDQQAIMDVNMPQKVAKILPAEEILARFERLIIARLEKEYTTYISLEELQRYIS